MQDKIHRDREAKKLRKALEKEKEKVIGFYSDFCRKFHTQGRFIFDRFCLLTPKTKIKPNLFCQFQLYSLTLPVNF